jgi:multicomponent Na+:H+ antiporter subunit G
MVFLDVLTIVAIVIALGFFSAGTVGILRFPDVYNRLHAATKVDNLGLGFVVLGLTLQTEAPLRIAKLVLIWLLMLVASTNTAQLIARAALRGGDRPWERDDPR